MSKNKAKKVGKSKKQTKTIEKQNANTQSGIRSVAESGNGTAPFQAVNASTSALPPSANDSTTEPQVTSKLDRCEITATPGTSFSVPGTYRKTSKVIVDKNNKLKVEVLVEDVKKCNISSPPKWHPAMAMAMPAIVFHETKDPDIISKWPRVKKSKVPAIFFHKPVIFMDHIKDILTQGIKFYFPKYKESHMKITCPTLEDHKLLVKYFDKNNLPYHTFSHPAKKWVKVVIRGLPDQVNEKILRSALKSVSVPVKRIHKMHIKESQKGTKTFILAVVPLKPEARKLFRIKSIFGQMVKIEPPISKSKQCHRCQKWGHNQRFCRGDVKCVKCADDHSSSDCTMDKTKPPLCVNCGGGHTASFRLCPFCPDSRAYQLTQKAKQALGLIDESDLSQSELVTLDNYGKLYDIVNNIP